MSNNNTDGLVQQWIVWIDNMFSITSVKIMNKTTTIILLNMSSTPRVQ